MVTIQMHAPNCCFSPAVITLMLLPRSVSQGAPPPYYRWQHPCTPAIFSQVYVLLYLNQPTFSPEDSSLPPACALVITCPPCGERKMQRRVFCTLISWVFLGKWTFSVSEGAPIWDRLSSPHPSITPVTWPLGPLRSSSDPLLLLFSGCSS